MLKHSVVSGKKVIYFDKATVFESKTVYYLYINSSKQH